MLRLYGEEKEMFITFEGIEGCGKSTQIKLLQTFLKQSGSKVILTREPGGCKISDQIRSVLLDASNNAIAPITELMLYSAARAQHLAEVVRPALSKGFVVLCDRFSDATRAYQVFGRGIDRNVMETLNNITCEGIIPNLTLLLDCPVETGLQRAIQRIESVNGPREDRFELESIAFHQLVRDGYLTLASEEPERFAVIDATGSRQQVAERIADAVIQRIMAGK